MTGTVATAECPMDSDEPSGGAVNVVRCTEQVQAAVGNEGRIEDNRKADADADDDHLNGKDGNKDNFRSHDD